VSPFFCISWISKSALVSPVGDVPPVPFGSLMSSWAVAGSAQTSAAAIRARAGKHREICRTNISIENPMKVEILRCKGGAAYCHVRSMRGR
jgi:hypothetical protein